MEETECAGLCFVKCGACGVRFPAQIRPEGTLERVDFGPECACADPDVKWVLRWDRD